MRQVYLDGRKDPAAEGRRKKLAGHLCARLNEYREEGISARVEEDGAVLAGFSGVPAEKAVTLLAEGGVYALQAGAGVRFLMGGDTAFEELDYVQAVAARIISE